jgi:ATP/maltotriose-dependent transcriptional regulator MalT
VGNTAKRDAREVATTERQRQALELRLAGLTYDEIARKLGVHDRSAARSLVLRGIEKYRQRRDDAAEDLVEQILEDYAERKARCRALMTAYYPKAVRGDMKAAALLLDAQKDDRENDRDVRRMLGLDAPAKSELTGAAGGPIRFDVDPSDAILGKLAGLAAGGAARGGDPSAQSG